MAKESMTKPKENNSEQTVIDFGTRKVSNQNFSKMIALPKTALANCGCNLDEDLKVNVQLVQNNGERFIKLTPVCNTQTENQKKKEKK